MLDLDCWHLFSLSYMKNQWRTQDWCKDSWLIQFDSLVAILFCKHESTGPKEDMRPSGATSANHSIQDQCKSHQWPHARLMGTRYWVRHCQLERSLMWRDEWRYNTFTEYKDSIQRLNSWHEKTAVVSE